LILGAIAFVFSLLFKLVEVINAILAMRILIQFVGQAIGLILLSKRKGRNFMKWKMILFPLPVLLAITIWILLFLSTGWKMISSGLIVIGLGCVAYLVKAKLAKEWPFNSKEKED
jgi:hypothetical protein